MAQHTIQQDSSAPCWYAKDSPFFFFVHVSTLVMFPENFQPTLSSARQLNFVFCFLKVQC